MSGSATRDGIEFSAALRPHRATGPRPPTDFRPPQQREEEPVAVKLRLMRMGKTKQPTYRVVAADSRSPRDGRFIEIIGTYDPRQEPSVVKIDTEKAQAWISKGAQPTERVAKLLEVARKCRAGSHPLSVGNDRSGRTPQMLIEAGVRAIPTRPEKVVFSPHGNLLRSFSIGAASPSKGCWRTLAVWRGSIRVASSGTPNVVM